VSWLYLLRHAKSSWDDPALPDRDRPLAPRGRKAAKRIGDHLRERSIQPDLVLCSSARRTRETVARLRLPRGVPVEYEDELYAAGAGVLLARVRSLGDDVSAILLVAHNPGIQALAIELVDDEGAPFAKKLPTGALVVLEIESPWWALQRARLHEYVTPREL
jgi:phosphohistidine phosphatase